MSGRGTPRSWIRQILVMLIMVMGLMLVPSSSWAGPEWCTPEPAPTPAPPGVGAALTAADSDGPVSHIYESQLFEAYTAEQLGSSGQYQHRGMVWHVIITDDCLDTNRFNFWAALYEPLLTFSTETTQLAANVYMVASADTYQLMFHDLIVDVTSQLRDAFWRPMIPSAVIVGALILAWYAFVRKQTTLTFQGAVWMVVATSLGMWMLFAPTQVLSLSTAITSTGSSLVNQGVSEISVDGLSEHCPADATQPQRSPHETAGQFAARENAQTVWEGLMCRPWVEGLLGSTDHGRQVADTRGMQLLEATTITFQEAEDKDYQELLNNKQTLYQAITSDVLANSTVDSPNAEYEIFSGANGTHRLSVAVAAAMGALTGSLLLLVASLLLLAYKFAFSVSMLLAPAFLLIGILPGFGRGVMLKWLGFTLAYLIKQVMVMLVIGILILVLTLILSMPVGLLMQSILMIGLIIGLIMTWKPIWSMFKSVSQLTDRAVNTDAGRVRMPQMLKTLGRTATRAGMTAATGGAGGLASGFVGRRARAAGSAARGVGRRGQRPPLGLKRAEMDPRWGRVLNAKRTTDGDGDVQLRGAGRLNRVQDAMGKRPTSSEWRKENPVMAGWEAHRWSGMNRSERRAAVSEARSDPKGYMSRLRNERESWVQQVHKQKQGAPPPLTPHQQTRVDHKHRQLGEWQQKQADKWARRRRQRPPRRR